MYRKKNCTQYKKCNDTLQKLISLLQIFLTY